jgi:hypothetical protein
VGVNVVMVRVVVARRRRGRRTVEDDAAMAQHDGPADEAVQFAQLVQDDEYGGSLRVHLPEGEGQRFL